MSLLSPDCLRKKDIHNSSNLHIYRNISIERTQHPTNHEFVCSKGLRPPPTVVYHCCPYLCFGAHSGTTKGFDSTFAHCGVQHASPNPELLCGGGESEHLATTRCEVGA